MRVVLKMKKKLKQHREFPRETKKKDSLTVAVK